MFRAYNSLSRYCHWLAQGWVDMYSRRGHHCYWMLAGQGTENALRRGGLAQSPEKAISSLLRKLRRVGRVDVSCPNVACIPPKDPVSLSRPGELHEGRVSETR